MLRNCLIVGMGGFLGAILRYGIGGFIQTLSGRIDFPYGTLVINVSGCLLIGILSQLADLHAAFTAEMRLFLMMGFLGAYTTYSTFGNETVILLQDNRLLLAGVNIGAHLLFGLAAVLLGRMLILTLWR